MRPDRLGEGGIVGESRYDVPVQVRREVAEAGEIQLERRNTGAQCRFHREHGGHELLAQHVVVAAGAWSHLLARTLGHRFPLETERGYNTTLPAGAFDLRRQLTFGSHGFVVTPIAGGVRVGGAVELGGLKAPPDAPTACNATCQFAPCFRVTRVGGFQYGNRGTVTIDGLVPRTSGTRPTFGVVFQSGALLGSLTVAENVALPLREWTPLPLDAIGAIVAAKLRLVGLQGTEELMPADLSGGMRKRAAIARAMALEPDLLFLDEPSADLDPITAAGLDELIMVLSRELGLTFVVVTHDLESILKIAQDCIMLDHASRSIIARGDPQTLRASGDDPRVHSFFNRTPQEVTA